VTAYITIKTHVHGIVKKIWRGTPRASATCTCPANRDHEI